MQIVIEIPEEIYKQIQEEQWLPNRLLIEKAIANGTPLPKGHGRIHYLVPHYKEDDIKYDIEPTYLDDKIPYMAESEG